MDVASFCRRSSVVIVAGKGGTGKTTVSTSLALVAARAGLDVLLTELDPSGAAARLLGAEGVADEGESSLRPSKGGGTIRTESLKPDDALMEYLGTHGMSRISRRLFSSGALDVVSTAVPGVPDILLLGKLKQLEKSHRADLVILDAPAAGHSLTFLTSPSGLAELARSGAIRSQATEVLEMLHDPSRCQVMLVALAEETPVNETVETAYALEDKAGVALAPVVVNSLYPRLKGLVSDVSALPEGASEALGRSQVEALVRASRFRMRRQELQAEQIRRLSDMLPLPQLHLPFLFAPAEGAPALSLLQDALADGILSLEEPEAHSGPSVEGRAQSTP